MAVQNSKSEIRNPKPKSWLRFRISDFVLRISVLAAAICLILTAVPARAQEVAWGRKTCPPCPAPVEKPALEIKPEPPPSPAQPPTEPLLTPERAGAFEGETVALAPPNMIGDLLAPSCTVRTVTVFVQGPTIFVPGTPGTASTPGTPGLGFRDPTTGMVVVIRAPVPGTPATPGTPGVTIPGTPVATTATFVVPSESHSFKIADNESPRPQDRLIGTFNFFNFVEGQANQRIGAGVGNVNFYREIIGFEKTFFDGYASLGMRLPFDLLDVGGIDMTSGDVGDLSIILKAILLQDSELNFLISGGLSVTVPTGPTALGGPGFVLDSFNDTLLQPFVGLLWSSGDFFIHGFSSIDIPTDANDATFLFNDLGFGYFLLRNRPEGFVTAVAPTIEVHVNTPLDHRHPSSDCVVGLTDWVDVTGGVTFEFNRRSTLALGISAPVTGPKPYAMEAMTHLNIRF